MVPLTDRPDLIEGVSRRRLLKAGTVAPGAFGLSTPSAATGVTMAAADAFGQGPGGSVVAEDGATLGRTPNGISMTVSMPTPKPGSYTYPSGPPGGAWTDEEGPPEGFTLWAFVFNEPDSCDGDCGGDDPFGGPAGKGGPSSWRGTSWAVRR